MKKLDFDKLSWYAYVYDLYGKRIVGYNIFDNTKVRKVVEDIVEELKKGKNIDIGEELKASLIWAFWSKFEYETILAPFPPRAKENQVVECLPTNEVQIENAIKIDVYDQVMLNFDRFVEYVKRELGIND